MKRLSSLYAQRIAGACLAGIMVLSLSGCDDHFAGGGAEPEQKFEGIQVTFEDGRQGGSIGNASDDWRPIPQAALTIGSAVPNPVTPSPSWDMRTSIAFALAQGESIRLWIDSSPGVLDMEVFNGEMEVGDHELVVDFTGKQPGIYRAYLSVRREGAVYTTYGDIMVKQ